MLAIYIHIPFCKSKCPYCNFTSISSKDHKAYVDALISEIEFYGKGQKVDTIFFGGGTPTCIDIKYIEDIITSLKKNFVLRDDIEITIEANPGTVDLDSLTHYYDMGINRISFGLQSTDNNELKTLGRIHTIEDFEESYNIARQVGFDNINIDLMFGLLGQTQDSFYKTVNRVAGYNPEHISAYSLKIEEGTPYYDKYHDSEMLPSEDAERNMYHYANKALRDAGYIHYETSNFSKQKRACRHNLIYWKNEQYFGFGASAHGYIDVDGDKIRYSNVCDIDEYIRLIASGQMPIDEKTVLCAKDLKDEYIMLHLRLNTGIEFLDYNGRFDADFEHEFKGQIEQLIKNKLLTKDKYGVYPTLLGFDLQNTMITMFL